MEPEDGFDATRVTMSKLRRSSAPFATPQPPPHVEDDTPKGHYATAPNFRGPSGPTLLQEVPNMALLVVLYMMQVRRTRRGHHAPWQCATTTAWLFTVRRNVHAGGDQRAAGWTAGACIPTSAQSTCAKAGAM